MNRRELLGRAVMPVTRRFEFPGKRRLRRAVHVPSSGVRELGLAGARFRVDLAESLHRDYYFGLVDHVELRLLRRVLADGGDFVDVGAHIGLYTVSAARRLGSGGRVLAFEPNPVARARLEENVALNACGNVEISGSAVGAAPGRAVLYVPRQGDSAWSSLAGDRVAGSEPLEIALTTLDAEVARRNLRPAAVKIDVEGGEVDVLAGASDVLDASPALFIEVAADGAAGVVSALQGRGYAVARAGTRRVQPWPTARGWWNAVFLQPRHLSLLGRRERRAFA